ncbi:aldehyde dehydrogenase [Alcanivorax xiamenensis]|uniref:aldehyde dehydrogenase (NAD(+)) n=1 Tax=Alcanivorax xiamenensis TaxID=1177156 RepID=A0ABQ6Y7F5_9GAMM|nr:aldehyde dehydrogenase family protein [Alcanivorax xiamenensis]KAF0805388.1 aldehyde dehydrogenase [Alcanivorax xiamenensis]
MSKIDIETGYLNRANHFIDGRWQAADGQQRRELVNPYDESGFGSVALGTAEDVDAAVKAARAALPSWSALPRHQRAKWCYAIAEALKEKAELLARLESLNVGSPISFSRMAHAQVAVAITASYGEFLERGGHDEVIGNSRVVREPIGVVGAIAAWNYPLMLLLGKAIPAIAAGCTVVAKPSEVTPLTSMVVADVLQEVGLPAGVINIVNGDGPTVGEALVNHRGVDMVSFTGSTAVGRRIMANAATQVKKVALELGGKSATVVLDDAPLEQAVRGAVRGAYPNAGQTCIALSRLIVPGNLIDQALDIAADEAGRFIAGDPMDERTTLGPLAFAGHHQRVAEYIRLGQREATLIAGGEGLPDGVERGFFVKPTVFGRVDPQARIAQEEIFGPVLSVIAAGSEEQAIDIANGTIYGLNGAVWSADPERAVRAARRMQCGKVDINGGGFNLDAPAGGFKQSGIGRERGHYALEEYMEVKSLQFADADLARASALE